MTTLPVIIVPNPILKQKAKPIERVDGEVRKQMDAMLETMYQSNGIGLAANQVACLQRILVIDLARDGQESRPIKMANPKIVWESDEMSEMEEGCLSIPSQAALVQRPAEVKVSYLDYNGDEAELAADGLLSHCVQHEIDHLNGILCIDYLSSIKRNIIIRKVQRAQKSAQLL